MLPQIGNAVQHDVERVDRSLQAACKRACLGGGDHGNELTSFFPLPPQVWGGRCTGFWARTTARMQMTPQVIGPLQAP